MNEKATCCETGKKKKKKLREKLIRTKYNNFLLIFTIIEFIFRVSLLIHFVLISIMIFPCISSDGFQLSHSCWDRRADVTLYLLLVFFLFAMSNDALCKQWYKLLTEMECDEVVQCVYLFNWRRLASSSINTLVSFQTFHKQDSHFWVDSLSTRDRKWRKKMDGKSIKKVCYFRTWKLIFLPTTTE